MIFDIIFNETQDPEL